MDKFLAAVPKWLFSAAFLALVIIVGLTYFSEKPFLIAGDEFGFSSKDANPLANIKGLSIIEHGSTHNRTDKPSFEDTIDLKSDGVLLMTASGKGGRKGTVANAGITLSISVDGETCAQSQSFEGSSTSITFFTSATCIKLLKKGKHKIIVERSDQGGINRSRSLSAEFIVLEANK